MSAGRMERDKDRAELATWKQGLGRRQRCRLGMCVRERGGDFLRATVSPSSPACLENASTAVEYSNQHAACAWTCYQYVHSRGGCPYATIRLRYLRLGIQACTSTRKGQQLTGALTLGIRDGHVVEHRAWPEVEGTLEVEPDGLYVLCLVAATWFS